MAAALALPFFLLTHFSSCLYDRTIELNLLSHQQFDVISASISVEVLVVQGRVTSPFGVILFGICPLLTMSYVVGRSRSTVLATEDTEHAGVPRRL